MRCVNLQGTDLLIPDKDSELFRRQHYKIYPK